MMLSEYNWEGSWKVLIYLVCIYLPLLGILLLMLSNTMCLCIWIEILNLMQQQRDTLCGFF